MDSRKKLFEKFFQWAAVWGGFAFCAIAVTAAYALTYNWTDPSALRGKTAGNQLQSSQWNLLIGNVDNLNERLSNAETAVASLSSAMPAGAVVAFYGTACPTGWSPADGTVNGVKKTDGTPGTLDLRGEFVRGLDAAGAGARNVDTGRTLGTSQSASQVMGGGGNPSPPYLSGNNWIIATDNGATNTIVWPSNLEQVSYWTFNGNFLMGWSGYSTWPTSWNVGQVRPRNVALLYCVKN